MGSHLWHSEAYCISRPDHSYGFYGIWCCKTNPLRSYFEVIMLGATFYIASEVLELAEHVGAISDLSGNAMLFLSFPLAILDGFFILWIFTSLSATLNNFRKTTQESRRLSIKLVPLQTSFVYQHLKYWRGNLTWLQR